MTERSRPHDGYNQSPLIQEAYTDFTPAPWVRTAVARLLDGIPPTYLTGLKIVALTNSSSWNRSRRRQKIFVGKRKVSLQESRGCYHRKCEDRPARIEIVVDLTVFGDGKGWWFRRKLVQDLFFADVLFHEVGHHIHRAMVPDHRDPEVVADEWARKLREIYFRHRYWYFRALSAILAPAWKLFGKRLMKPFEVEMSKADKG